MSQGMYPGLFSRHSKVCLIVHILFVITILTLSNRRGLRFPLLGWTMSSSAMPRSPQRVHCSNL